jgi:lysophospholipase L1-like esterase
MQLSRKRIRLQIDAAKTGQPILDLYTGQTPAIFAGTDVQLEIGLFQNGVLLDVGNLASLQIDLKSPGSLLGPSALAALTSALDNTTTYAAWSAGAQQHALVGLSNSQTNLAIPSAQTFTLVVSGATTDNPGRLIVYGSTQFTVTPAGINSGASPAPAVPTFYTGGQSDARYLQLGAAGQTVTQPVTLAQGVTLGQIPVLTSPQALTLPPLPGLANSALVPAGPYVALPSGGAANFGPNAAQTSLEVVNTTRFWRLRQSGSVTAVTLYLPSAAGLTGFYAKVWRLNSAGAYDLIGVSENFAPALGAGTVSHTLSTPIPNVREGDFLGFRAEWSAGAAAQNFQSLGASSCYSVLNASPLSGSYNWSAQTSNNTAVPLQAQMAAPWFVVLGDSLMSGYPETLSYADTSSNMAPDSPADSFACYLGRALGLSYQNMAVSGQTSAQIAARAASDCVGLRPRFAVLEGGNNDLLAGNSPSSVVAAYATMLGACQAAGILPVILLIPSFRNYSGSSAAIMTNRDAVNASLAALGATYNAVVADPNPVVGAAASDGPPGNFWALQAQFDSGDGIHLNSAGYARLAQVAAQALCSLTLRGRLTIGGLALNGNLTLDGQSPREIDLGRNPNYQAAGASLGLRAGGASPNGPNLNGGSLLLSSGLSTGNGFSSVMLRTAPAGSSGSGDNLPAQRLLLRQSAGSAQCNLYGDAGNGAQFALYPNGGSPALALYAPVSGPSGLASGSANPQPVLGIDASDNVTVEYTLTVGSQSALGLGGAQLNLTSAGLTRLAIQSIGANDAQISFYNGSAFKYALGWDQPSNKFALYGYIGGGSFAVLSVDAAGNLAAQGGLTAQGNVAATLALTGASAVIGGNAHAGESLLYVQGAAGVNALNCLAKFMASPTQGVWLSYDTTNHCGLIGANTEGVSNDPLALCTQGGSLYVGSPSPLSGSGFSTALLQVSGNAGFEGGIFAGNGLVVTSGGAAVAGNTSITGALSVSASSTAASAIVGGNAHAGESLLYVQGAAGVNALNCVAKFMASPSQGVWLSYDTTNHCGLIGANTEAVSNDNLAVCTQGGCVLIGGTGADTGSGAILQIHGLPQFAGTNTTGAGSAALGANCPASTASAPYTWIEAKAADGSTVYLPAWK